MSESSKVSLQAFNWSQRAAFLEGAARLIEAKGISKFSTRALAEQPGISAGSLYRALGPRDVVLLALFEREGKRFSQRVETFESAAAGNKPRQDEPPWLPAVKSLVRASIAFYRERPALAADLHLEERRLRSLSPKGVRATMEAKFTALLKAHNLSSDEEELSAEYLVEMVTGMALVASRGEGVSDTMSVARTLAALKGYLDRFGAS